jgi:hypothetical protein
MRETARGDLARTRCLNCAELDRGHQGQQRNRKYGKQDKRHQHAVGSIAIAMEHLRAAEQHREQRGIE